MTKLIIELAESDDLGDAIAALGDWYGRQRLRSHGQWVTIGAGHGDSMFAWRITNLDIAEGPAVISEYNPEITSHREEAARLAKLAHEMVITHYGGKLAFDDGLTLALVHAVLAVADELAGLRQDRHEPKVRPSPWQES